MENCDCHLVYVYILFLLSYLLIVNLAQALEILTGCYILVQVSIFSFASFLSSLSVFPFL